VVWVVASGVKVQDLEVVGGSYYGIKVSPDFGPMPANASILRCKVHDTGRDAIKAYMADGLLVQDSEVYNTGVRDSSNAEGIDVMASIPSTADASAYGVIIRHNYIHQTATYGVYLKAGTQRGLIERNRVDTTGAGGILLGGDSGAEYMRNGARYDCIDCTARNNIVSNTQVSGLGCWGGSNIQFQNNTAINVAAAGQAGIFVLANSLGGTCNNLTLQNNIVVVSSTRPMIHLLSLTGSFTSDNNIFFSPSGNYSFWRESQSPAGYWNFSGWQNGTGQDLHSYAQDPLLNVSDLFKALAGSPTVDRGRAIPDLATDYSGGARPQGGGYDIGAHEVPVSVSGGSPTLSVASGNSQTTVIGTAFSTPLKARVVSGTGAGVAGVTVVFTAPSSAASGTFSGLATAAVVTDNDGYATAPALTANGVAGTFTVAASSSGLPSVNFSLTCTRRRRST